MTEHISRKELKQDKVRETFEHGAEAVLSHTRILTVTLLVMVLGAAGYLGWRLYSQREAAQSQMALDEAMKIYGAQLNVPGQPVLPGELTYSDASKRSEDALAKFNVVAAKYPHTDAGRQARYYAALSLMDLDRLNQATEELKKLAGSSDKEMAALAQYQMALIDERTGKTDEAIKLLRGLTTAGSVLVPKAMAQLELAGVLSQTDPKQAADIYTELKVKYPNTPVADQADRGLQLLASKS